jgi:phosphoribosyl 1,2-cyclic phosphodiesterase
MMKLSMIASSSSGNCTVVQSGDTTILVDAGISAKRTFQGLGELNLGERVDAIFISHEHSDHCKDLGVVSRRFKCPIYGTKETLAELGSYLKGTETLFEIEKGKSLAFQDVEIVPFSVSHDAVDPCGFTITNGQKRIGVCTDLGTMTDEVKKHLGDCDAISFEANHDVEMLSNGRYPKYLQDRIRSSLGHLSNDESGQGLAILGMQGRLRHAILAHLSDSNNRPDIALKTVQHTLRTYAVDLNVLLSHKTKPSQLIEL